MSDILIFNLARRLKRRWSKEAMAALDQAEVDEINAVLKDWKKSAATAPAPPAEREKLSIAVPAAPKALAAPGAFFAAVRGAFGGLSQEQVDGINALLTAMGTAGWPIAWVAYGLATSWHETAKTMQPIKEYGGATYFHKMYDIQGERPKKARELGNLSPGDGAKYAGRGYVQLTGKANYVKAGLALGIDLPEVPDLAMKPDAAAKILTWGMAGGEFTGKALKDYLPQHGPADHRQLVLARYIINGQDKASAIADLALKFQTALSLGQWA